MDSKGFSQVGRYGTICLMKCQEPDTVVAAFGIDTEELTFGRDPGCGVRLYYQDVSLVHCKVVFEERKAFLVVLGGNGCMVDGCRVYPNGSPNALSPTTVPLTNDSEFEIHGKRFRFSYPPKDMRAALFATPARPTHRKLRLSMIQSAQVFSPRPSNDPRENLRILKSPLKNAFKSPVKGGPSTLPRTNLFPTSTPRKTVTEPEFNTNHDEEADEIILVDGNHPRVVENEQDLVILEDVDASALDPNATPTQHHVPQIHAPSPQPPPQTPARSRSLSRNTLHRAVLIRSVQRAVLQAEYAEREREEEEEEEMEVLETVASDAASEGEADEDEDSENDSEGGDGGETDEDDQVEEYEEELRGRGRENSSTAQKSTWRKSLERIWPFRSSSTPPSDGEELDQDQEAESSPSEAESEGEAHSQSGGEERGEEQDIPAPLPSRPQQGPPQTPVRRALGSFMTPQARLSTNPALDSSSGAFDRPGQPAVSQGPATGRPGRYSLGGGEARRVVRSEQVWKVQDIVVPPASEREASASQTAHSTPAAIPTTPGTKPAVYASPVRARPVVTEEERKAIQERRRSALREVDPFFAGGVPGMGASPNKRRGWTPAKPSASSSIAAGAPPGIATPFKPVSPSKAIPQYSRDDDDDDMEEQMDTRGLLERMKETVEDMKRRRSLAPATPGRSLAPATPARDRTADFGWTPKAASPTKRAPLVLEATEEEEEDNKENTMDTDDKENVIDDKENGVKVVEDEMGMMEETREDEEPFSLLRPGVLEEVRAKEQNTEAETPHHDEALFVPIVPTALEDPLAPEVTEAQDEARGDDEPAAPKKAGRARLVRAKQPASKDTTPEESAAPQEPSPKTLQTASPRESSAEDAPEPAPSRPHSRRARKPTVEPEAEAEADSAPFRRSRRTPAAELEPTPVPASKRGRKAAAESEAPAQEEAAPVPARRGRKPAVPTASDIVEEEEKAKSATPALAKRGAKKAALEPSEGVPVPGRRARTPRSVPSALPVRKIAAGPAASGSGGVRRGTRGKPAGVAVVEDGDDDPLDAMGAEETEAPVAKPKGRKKVVKEEDAEESLVVPAVAKGGKARAAAVKTPVGKARARKTPATAPAAVLGVDKENTPGSEGSQAEADEPVKIRVSRTRKGAAVAVTRSAKVKQEEEQFLEVDAEPEPVRGRSARATRARTRT